MKKWLMRRLGLRERKAAAAQSAPGAPAAGWQNDVQVGGNIDWQAGVVNLTVQESKLALPVTVKVPVGTWCLITGKLMMGLAARFGTVDKTQSNIVAPGAAQKGKVIT